MQLDFEVNVKSSRPWDPIPEKNKQTNIKHIIPLHPQTGSKPHLSVPDVSMTTGKPLSVLPWLPFGEVKLL